MKWFLSGVFVLFTTTLTAAACGGSEEKASSSARTLEAPSAAITVDGETSDWEGVDALDVTLDPIQGEQHSESKTASVKVAHDDENVYVLFEVEDDYNWDANDAHLSAASAVMWNIDPAAGPHMGAEDPSGEPGLGTVDIWHWELECASGEETGGAVSDPGEGEDPGNDGKCNFDDEYASDPEEREDDNGAGAENSLLGVWSHTDATADAEGTWVFEVRRPLQTGDEGDGQLAVGETAQLALAYWDPDNSPEGWEDDEHAQSAGDGWIEVTFV